MIKMTEFAKRRSDLMKKIGSQGVVILTAAPIPYRNNYHEFPYRQNSDFYYMTGFEEPEAVAILLAKKQGCEFILFNRTRDPEKEIWDGDRAGQELAVKQFGANAAFPIEELEKKLPELLEGRSEIHYALGVDTKFDSLLLKTVNKLRGKIRTGLQSPLAFVDIQPTLHEMRLIKSPAEIELMRDAANISAQAHIRAMQICKPGLYEYQLEAEIMHEFLRNGSRAPAYTPIIGNGRNSCILHYVQNNQKIADKSMVLIDAGAEYQYYASDVTRTFPSNGRFSPEQKAIYEIVLTAQTEGIKSVRAGSPWPKTHEIAVKVITEGLRELKLLKGNLTDLIESEAYLPFYMHRAGHWLGIDVHDVGRYKVDGKWRNLEPNMTFTVEPGIYITKNIKGVPEKWHNIGVRIEDDIVVTEKGCEVLSKNVPKTISEIEGIMR